MNNGIPTHLLPGSVQHHGAERDLRFLRLDAKDHKLLALQTLLKALLIKFVFVQAKAEPLSAPVGDPLPRPLGPQARQVPLKSAQGLLVQVGSLVSGHRPSFLQKAGEVRSEIPGTPGALAPGSVRRAWCRSKPG